MEWLIVIALLWPLSVRADESAPRLTSDSPEYCAELKSRFAAIAAEAPGHLRLLAEEGSRLCAEGHMRSGIAKLRRALKEASRGE
jgi:hypothetical protein